MVTRWGFVFADYMCQDLAVELIKGRHCPIQTNTTIVNETNYSVASVKSITRCNQGNSRSTSAATSVRSLSKEPMLERDDTKFGTASLIMMPSDVSNESMDSNSWRRIAMDDPPHPPRTNFNCNLARDDGMSVLSTSGSIGRGYPLNYASDDVSSYASVAQGRGTLNLSAVSRPKRGFGHGRGMIQ